GGRGITRSEGPSIKLAQQEAARRALETPEALAEAITAYQERRAARSNRHHMPETVAEAPAVVAAATIADNPRPRDFDEDNPFLAIVEELEAAQNGPGANGASATRPAESATGAAAASAANIETPTEDEADTGR